MSNFREFDRETRFLLPPSLDEWLPEQHLARFVVEVIDGLDLSAMVKSYRGTGSAGYHPALVLGLLVYGYATGVFSSRKLERVTYDSVAFRFIAVNQHPDHDTIATFRRRFLKDIEALFVRPELAREMGLLKLGTVALLGSSAGNLNALAMLHPPLAPPVNMAAVMTSSLAQQAAIRFESRALPRGLPLTCKLLAMDWLLDLRGRCSVKSHGIASAGATLGG